MQIFTFNWLNSFALFDHFQASQSHFYIYSNSEAAQCNNELLSEHRDLQLLVRERKAFLIHRRLGNKLIVTACSLEAPTTILFTKTISAPLRKQFY